MIKLTLSENKIKKFTLVFFSVFIIIQPFLDYYFLFSDSIKKYTYISPSTIIRFLSVGILFLIVLSTERHNKKAVIVWAVYFAAVLAYFLLHQAICSAFPYQLPEYFTYNGTDELSYTLRIILPLLLMYITYKQDLTFELVKTITLALTLIIGITFVVSNLAGFSLIAYSESYELSKYSFLDWFKSQSGIFCNELTSKGLFYKSNQISGIMLLLLPVNLMFFLNKRSIIGFLAVLLLMLCMFMTGARAALYGMILALAAVLCLRVITLVAEKQRVSAVSLTAYLCFIAFFAAIYPFSPCHNRLVYEENAYDEFEETPLSEVDDPGSDIDLPSGDPDFTVLVGNLISRLTQVNIPDIYYKKYYPVEYDYDFWKDLDNLQYANYCDSRKQQQLITERIFNRISSNQWKYSLFGMGRSRFASSTILLEKDFLQQRYTLGFIGLLLFFAPYLIAIGRCGIIIILNLKKLFSFENLTLLFSVVLFFASSVFSGHLIDELFPIFICVLYLGYITGRLTKAAAKLQSSRGEGTDTDVRVSVEEQPEPVSAR